MGKIIGLILLILVFYIVWKLIKRIFFFKVFKSLNDFPKNPYREQQKEGNTKKQREFKKDIKWDAETVEYEEIPDNESKKTKS